MSRVLSIKDQLFSCRFPAVAFGDCILSVHCTQSTTQGFATKDSAERPALWLQQACAQPRHPLFIFLSKKESLDSNSLWVEVFYIFQWNCQVGLLQNRFLSASCGYPTLHMIIPVPGMSFFLLLHPANYPGIHPLRPPSNVSDTFLPYLPSQN